MKKISLIVLLLLVGFSKITSACQCNGIMPDFFDFMVKQKPFWHLMDVAIVKATVLEPVHGLGTSLKVHHSYYGSTNNDTVVSWGNSGQDCRLSLNDIYSPGDTIIAILERNIICYTQYETTDDYYVWMCGFNHVLIKGDSVYGGAFTSFSFYGFPLSGFEDSLSHHLQVLDLHDVPKEESFHAQVFPNPASGIVTVDWNMSVSGLVGMTITDISGKTVKAHPQRIFDKGRNIVTIDFSEFSRGIYFIVLYNQEKRQIIRLAAQ